MDELLFQERRKKKRAEARHGIINKLDEIGLQYEDINEYFILVKDIPYSPKISLWGMLNLKLAEIDIKEAYIPTRGYINRYSKDYMVNNNLAKYDKFTNALKEEGFELNYFTEVKEI